MSDITAIEPTALGPTPLPGATIPPPAVSTGQPQATGGNADQPAVVVDLSAAATTSLQVASTALAMDPDQVDYALSWATGVNGFAATAARGKAADVAATAARWNEADVAAAFGTATAERGTAVVIGAAVGSPSQALYYAANLGIPILDSVSPDAIKSGASAGTIGIGAFSFTHDGSTYAVTPGAEGSISGTKDGQPWRTWQLASPADAAGFGVGEAPASQTLTSLTAQRNASADKPLAEIDVSA
jgi:hypothetical protein